MGQSRVRYRRRVNGRRLGRVDEYIMVLGVLFLDLAFGLLGRFYGQR